MSDTQGPPPGTQGLALAEQCFGPLLSPIAASLISAFWCSGYARRSGRLHSPAEWTAYAQHRRRTNRQFKNVFRRRKRLINDAIALIEGEPSLDVGTLQKCVSILSRDVAWDDDDLRDAEIGARIYSLAAPKYVEVHLKYHHRPGSYDVEWDYALGYALRPRISESAPPEAYRNPSTTDAPSAWHARDGWRQICWGYFADDDDDQDMGAFDFWDSYPDWRTVEEGAVGLDGGGVLDIYETLFGPIDAPPSDDAEAVLVFAAVGIDYRVACTDEEMNGGFETFSLEGLSDSWVARGIRAACGFQLSYDAEEAKLGEEERRKEATRKLGHDDEDEDEDEDDYSDE